MAVYIVGPDGTAEHANAEKLKSRLIASEPELEHPKVRLAIIPQVFAKNREIDCVLVFADARPPGDQFVTSQGVPVQSFVACVEIKNQSSDAMRRHGSHLEVLYDGGWHDASAQAEAQVWALKDFQQISYAGKARRNKTFVHSVIWLPRVAPNSITESLSTERTRIYCDDLSWKQLIDGFEVNRAQGKVQTLVSVGQDSEHHSYESLIRALTAKVEPTRLDLKRLNELTKNRFDADEQQYVRNLGSGLLMFRGRAGTGKTFALIQMAIYLARQGQSTRIVTYNHGLISDMARAMTIIRDRYEDISPIPEIETRWMLMEQLFRLRYGREPLRILGKLYDDLTDRESVFLHALRHPSTFLREAVPCCASNASAKKCHCTQEQPLIWADVCTYREKITPPYDFLLVDEGQDWSTEHRDLMYDIFGPGRIIVADGIDQFVNNDRCNWDRGDIPKNRIQPLYTSRRTKAATCDTITDIAHTLQVPNWDVRPDQAVSGGRVTVLVESQPYRAIERVLDLLDADLAAQPNVHPVDSLICLPHAGATPGVNYCNLFESVQEEKGGDYWRGYDWQTRQNREYPSRQTSLRAVLYESCRGMEGWTTACVGLDAFYNYVMAKPNLDIDSLRHGLEADHGMFFKETMLEDTVAAEQRSYALNWLMIALTRSMDHLVIHLTDSESALGNVLRKIDRDKVSWL